MPVFDWDERGVPIVKPGFKYYLAVTLPMTFLVLLTWPSAMFLPWKKWIGGHQKREKDAMEDLD
jgi:hypothetical protein